MSWQIFLLTVHIPTLIQSAYLCSLRSFVHYTFLTLTADVNAQASRLITHAFIGAFYDKITLQQHWALSVYVTANRIAFVG